MNLEAWRRALQAGDAGFGHAASAERQFPPAL